MITTRTLKKSRKHDFPGTRNDREWPPLTKCCNSEIFYHSHNGCDKEKIVFETHYYCQKCKQFLGFRHNETPFIKSKEEMK